MLKRLLLCLTCLTTITMAGVLRLGTTTNRINLRNIEDLLLDMPSTMTMYIPLANVTAEVQMTKSDCVPQNMHVILGTNEHAFTLWDDKDIDQFVLYQSKKEQASFVIWKNNNTEIGCGMMGTFTEGGSTYTLEPMDTRMSRQPGNYDDDEQEQPVMVTLNGVPLTMRKVDISDTGIYNEYQYATEEISMMQEGIDAIMSSTPTSGEHPKTYEIELMIIADYSMFQKWLQKSRSFDYKIRESEAIRNIRLYYAHIFNGLNLRYCSMTDSGNKIKVVPVAVYVAKSASASFWTEMKPNKENYYFTQADKALKELEKWLMKHEATLPAFDAALLFTNNGLVTGGSSGKQSNNLRGMSNIMGICGQKRVSLNKDDGLYSSIQTAADQLDKSMGVYNGNGRFACSTKGQNDPQSIVHAHKDKFEKTDECSKRALWYFINYLSLSNKNCLESRNNYQTNWNTTLNTPRYEGQRYDVDEQCKFTHGLYSYHCVDDNDESGVCTQLACWKPFVAVCDAVPGQGASDGTSCGDKHWCMAGQCIADSDAPEHTGTACIHGDFKDIVDYTTGQGCYQLAIHSSHKCYNKQFRNKCCDTCSKVLRQDLLSINCEYGDKDISLCNSELNPSDCYNPIMADSCCESCRRYRMNITGCEYGDKLKDCDIITVEKLSCYQFNESCCHTCPRKQVGFKGCEWGNKVIWCSNFDKKSCYEPNFLRDCCEYCREHKYGPVGCEWGDMNSSCTVKDCQANAIQRKNCCKTCNNLTPSSTTASTSTHTSTSTIASTTSTTAPPTTSTTSKTKSTITTAPTTTPTTTLTTTPNTTPTTTPIEEISKPKTLYSQAPCDDTSKYCYEITFGGECYSRHVSCCATCSKYKIKDPFCQFGDKTTWCANYVAFEGIGKCETDANVKEECCYSCSFRGMIGTANVAADYPLLPVTNFIPNTCQDDANWCQDLYPGQCYDVINRNACCHKCYKERTIQADCRYGDHARWCKDIHEFYPGQCYNGIEKDRCCDTCHKAETGNRTCPYGDRYSWCKNSPDYCKKHRVDCCVSC